MSMNRSPSKYSFFVFGIFTVLRSIGESSNTYKARTTIGKLKPGAHSQIYTPNRERYKPFMLSFRQGQMRKLIQKEWIIHKHKVTASFQL